LTGDPALLIGKQGTAKTAIVEAIGNAFRERSKRLIAQGKEAKLFEFRIYDASKIQFEDLSGFPNPHAMSNGKMGYIQTPMTAWNADLIAFDEFSRQSPERQNNIFELIRSRRLQGEPTGTTWIFNCMNPFGMAGTEELDDALVDRHQWFIHVTCFTDMKSDVQDKIVGHVGNTDAVALKVWGGRSNASFDVSDKVNDNFADGGDLIDTIMRKAVAHYEYLQSEVGPLYSNFVSKYWCTLTADMAKKDWKVELSGRRAGMTLRALLAYRAVDLAMCEVDPNRTLTSLKDTFKTVFRMAIPIGISNATAAGVSGDALASINACVDSYSQFFDANNKSKQFTAIDIIFELLTTNSVQRKVELLINNVTDDIAKNQVWSDIINMTKSTQPDEARRASVTMSIIAHIMTVKPSIVPKNLQALIAKHSFCTTAGQSAQMLTITGQLALYSSEITAFLESFNSDIVKLHAKSLLIDKSQGYQKLPVTKAMFKRFIEEIKTDCNALDIMLKENHLIESASVTP
jgi:hypothetical protein